MIPMKKFSRFPALPQFVIPRLPGRKLVAACLGIGLLSAGAEGASRRPNIVLVTADDLGTDLGCYGDAKARTPVLDRFAAEGVRFAKTFVTQPSCSPSRASLLTGLYPHQNGQIGLSMQRNDEKTGRMVNDGFSLNEHVAVLPNTLAAAGYRTGIIGKMHVWPEEGFQWDFDRHNVKPGFGAPGTKDVRLVAEEAGKFVRQDPGKPFFLYVNYFDPHGPFAEKTFQFEGLPELVKQLGEVPVPGFVGFSSLPMRRSAAGYENAVARLDTGFGLLLDALDKAGAGETLVIFLGDNGAPFPRGKVSLYRAGVHVPMLAQWKGVAKAGTVVEAPVSGVDIFPTIASVAGARIPEGLPGRSFVPLLEGKTPPDWPKEAFAEFTFHETAQFLPARAVFDGKYELIRNLVHGRPHPSFPKPPVMEPERDLPSGAPASAAYELWKNLPEYELYNTEADPNAFTNLADRPEFREVRDRLAATLQAWREKTADPLLDARTLTELTAKVDDLNSKGLSWSGHPRPQPRRAPATPKPNQGQQIPAP
jgi:N-sulfoglucosamine sulfohydrolase